MSFSEKLIKLLEVPGREIRIYNNSPKSPFRNVLDAKIGFDYNVYNVTVFNHLNGNEFVFSQRINLNNTEQELSDFFDYIAKDIENSNI